MLCVYADRDVPVVFARSERMGDWDMDMEMAMACAWDWRGCSGRSCGVEFEGLMGSWLKGEF
jgi:hypothetical protein